MRYLDLRGLGKAAPGARCTVCIRLLGASSGGVHRLIQQRLERELSLTLRVVVSPQRHNETFHLLVLYHHTLLKCNSSESRVVNRQWIRWDFIPFSTFSSGYQLQWPWVSNYVSLCALAPTLNCVLNPNISNSLWHGSIVWMLGYSFVCRGEIRRGRWPPPLHGKTRWIPAS